MIMFILDTMCYGAMRRGVCFGLSIMMLCGLASNQVHAYLMGDDEQLCWLDGVITACTDVNTEGIVVSWTTLPPNELETGEKASVTCDITFDHTYVVAKAPSTHLVNHINIHSCDSDVTLCIPAVGSDIATHSPAQFGSAGNYTHELSLDAGLWTTICHGRIYTNRTGTLVKVDAAVAHFGLVVTDPPVDKTVIIAASVSGVSGLALIVGGLLGMLYIMKKNDVVLKFEDLVFDHGRHNPWKVTEASLIFKGSYKGIPIAIKQVNSKTKSNANAPKGDTKQQTVSFKTPSKNNKVSPGTEPGPVVLGRGTVVGGNNSTLQNQDPIKAMRKEMKILQKLRCPQIVQFIGVAFNNGSNFICTELMEQGTLSEVISNHSIQMTFEQKLNVCADLCKALFFMHSLSPAILHADIKSGNVFMTVDLRAKLGDFGSTAKEGRSQTSGTPAWMAPELLNGSSRNTKESDVFALAVTMWEVWTGKMPHSEFDSLPDEEYITEIGKFHAAYKTLSFKNHGKDSDITPSAITEIIMKSMSPEKSNRATSKELEAHFKNLLEDTEFMAKYEEVAEPEASDLLHKILPRHIADQLKNGGTVEPIQCDKVTILFSDIVGFTKISSQLSSLEVMTMLQRLYVEFDKITTRYCLFKVETIGDAYMVCGGLFEGKEVQAQMIVRQGLDMIRAAARIPVHLDRPELGTITIRVGAHTGPVVASVVGSLNPRFCLFGDTVNHASRMESNAVVQRFQVSQELKQCIGQEAPEFNLQLRGQIPIKGKGLQWTYWVEGLNPKDFLSHDFPPPEEK